MYVIVQGTMSDGFQVVGPFDDDWNEAYEYIKRTKRDNYTYSVMEMLFAAASDYGQVYISAPYVVMQGGVVMGFRITGVWQGKESAEEYTRLHLSNAPYAIMPLLRPDMRHEPPKSYTEVFGHEC